MEGAPCRVPSESMERAAGFPGRGCAALALTSLAAVAGALAVHPHVDVAVRLSTQRHLPATTALVLLGVAGLATAAVGLRWRRLALLGVAALSLGLAVAWLGLTPHRFSGPVVAPLSSQHGLHLTDAIALVPALVGVALLLRATRPRPRPRPTNS